MIQTLAWIPNLATILSDTHPPMTSPTEPPMTVAMQR